MDKRERDYILDQAMGDYGDELVRLAYTYVKEEHMAKDLAQNAFVKCYNQLEHFRKESELRTWLYRITINECKDYLKSWKCKKVQLVHYIHENTQKYQKSLDQKVVQDSVNQEIKKIVYSLPTKYKEIIYLYYYLSMTIDEISEVTGVNANTVKTRLRRGKKVLKPMMEEAEIYGSH
ncbi:sigma-70 family RNA polymerase sigma factor [Bacillus sp. es.034]|uniref:sigma-70 family RNA polymerase sigma factor n=1 Tax=Bacillus sp. es.034 TaxID=1761763 RepID=UPI000BF913AE|nr:sigma-70 family RNA polymerase sigma factor [Bacillus sp. es.034]PFG05214.1 RNA polymerase sigma-70 factor (ECF subfamily) [Bacillus sp. es.034]